MEREGDEVMIIVIGVREVLDIPAEGFIGRHHGDGLIVHIGRYAAFRHLDDDFVALLHCLVEQTGDVEVATGCCVSSRSNENHYAAGRS